MPRDMLREAAVWQENLRKAYTAGDVQYLRAPGDESFPVRATKGRSIFEVDDGSGFTVQLETTDWLILAEDFVDGGGELMVPAVGDQVIDAWSNAISRSYEVIAPSGRPQWRWSDPYHTTLRIHTKYVDTTIPTP